MRGFQAYRIHRTFAVGGDRGQGRVLILADHSVFINDMMLQPDNDNIEFAYNCIRWLTGPGQRDRVLFVEEGAIVTKFDVPVKEIPLPPLPPVEELVPVANRILAGLEDENAFNRLLFGGVSLEGVLRNLILYLTLGLVAFGLLRLMKACYRLDPHSPLFEASVARLAPAGAVVDLRHQAMLLEGNLWEPARDLARQCFAGASPNLLAGAEPGVPPPITVNARWGQRRALRKQVRRLWGLAYGADPVRVSPRQFTRLLAEVEAVQAALGNGTLRFDSPGRQS